MFSTSGDIIMNVGGYHVYIRGCSVHQRSTISTLGGGGGGGKDVQYIGGYHDACGGYHEYIEGCSAHQRDIMMHLGEQLDKSFQFLLKTPVYS